MDPAKQREISARGGRGQKPEDRAFAKDRDLASEAGRKSKRAPEE